MRLVQFKDDSRHVATVEQGGKVLRILDGTESTYHLAQDAIAAGCGLEALAADRAGGEIVDYDAMVEQGRLLPPLDNPDPARCLVTGTGLTHLGSADARDKMHAEVKAEEETLTDSMKMFRMGLEGGKPQPGGIGVQPEWFYKGNGTCIVPPGAPLPMPAFALDGGEEPEIVGLYVVDGEGVPRRLGFALGNEFSDHVMERQNYLLLAHSKLRACSIGPELLLGELPQDVRGTSRVVRAGKVLWQAEFLSGEANMSHSISNLEHHHFKYAMFRRPGDVHCHFFGAATLSFTAGVKTRPGDVFEIDAPLFGRPLRNTLARAAAEPVEIRTL
ncbi:MAG: AraD1 family protein [Alphaproteobacteria bacterium]